MGIGLIEQRIFLLAGAEYFFGDIERGEDGDIERGPVAYFGGGLLHFLVEIGRRAPDILGVAPFAGAQLVGLFEDFDRNGFFLRHKSWEKIKSGDSRDLPLSRKPPLLRANHVVGRQYIGGGNICQRYIDVLITFLQNALGGKRLAMISEVFC